MSLCFLEAFQEKQKGNITEQEYIHHLFVHCEGVEHERDELVRMDLELLETDPFGYWVRCWSRLMDHVKDATPFEDVFTAYRTGDINQVKASLGRLSEGHAEHIRGFLALLAVLDRRSDILKLCFDQGGFRYEYCFEVAANRVNASDDPETFKVLEESEFRKLYPWRPPYNEEDAEEESDGEKDPSEVFDIGGRLPVLW